jgi:hypothetical protein
MVDLRAVPDCPNLEATRDLLYRCLADDSADDHGPGATGTRSTQQCCAPADSIRTDRPVRAAELPAELRGVHQHLLQHFAATGTAPTPADLAELAASSAIDPAEVLSSLAEHDLVAVNHDGGLVAAYPFSPTPTEHVVELDAVRVYAMCAIDAPGIPAMLERDATISSTDPHTGQPVTVTVAGGVAVFDPETTVVVYATTGSGGRSGDTCCSTTNFFVDTTNAQAWINAHPGLTATVLDQNSAVALGTDVFGPLLHQATPAHQ